MPTVKEETRRLVEKLAENSTWDDLMHEICVRQPSRRGLVIP
jgi:hypothetical protein